MSTPRSVQTSRRQRIRQGVIIALVSLLLVAAAWSLGLFKNGQLWLTDSYFVGDETSGDVVIVALDDASLSQYGRSPAEWSRSLYADLVNILSSGGARVVALDLLFSEPTPDDETLANALLAARQSDTRTRTVLATSGTLEIVTGTPDMIAFEASLLPVDVLLEVADYRGYVNTVADVDGTLRRQPSQVYINGETQLSFALATYLAYLRIPSTAVSQVVTLSGDTLNVTPERQLAIDDNGLWIQNFFGAPGKTFQTYSFQAVLNGSVPPGTFADKIVLVGLHGATGVIDQYPVPSNHSGELMPGVEIQANAVETLIQNASLHEQPALSQFMTFALLSLVAALLYTQVVWYVRLLLIPVMLLAVFVAASLNFSLRSEITNLLYSLLAVMLPAIITLGVDTTVEINKRRRAELLLESIVSVSTQQMDVEKILPRIATDICRMVDVQAGAIWLVDEQITHEFPEGSKALKQLDDLYQRVKLDNKTHLHGLQIAVPILWQGRLIGVIGVDRQREKSTDRDLLEDLAQRIAPGLENALLYHEIQKQKQTLEAVLYGSPSFSLLLDDELRIYRANEAFLKWRADKIAHKPLLELLGELQDDIRHQLSVDFSRRQNFQTEVRAGSQTFNLHATYLPDHHLWVVLLSDVSAIAELSRLKTQMIRMASHDLKNPLGAVLGYTDLLLMDSNQFDQDQIRFLETIRRSGETMRTIIEDILNLEQLRAADTPQEDVDFSQLAYEVISRHEADMVYKGQNFTVEIAKDLPPVRGRPVQLSQVITNLLGNAVKYTPDEGQIWLRLYQNSPDTLRLEIQDTGYGISKEAQAKLFTEFYRVKTKETAHIPGTGLGLSLVKTVVESHQGRIGVESEEGKGSTFFVELPFIKEAVHV